MRTVHLRLAGGLLVASLVLAACGGVGAPLPTETEAPDVIIAPPPVIHVTATPGPAQALDFKSKDPTSFTKVQIDEPDTLDPALSVVKTGAEIIQNVYETLVTFQRESVTTFVPQLAVEVPSQQNGGISSDGRIYTFKIRPGVKFHNGDPLTPQDVAYSFQRQLLMGGSASPQWLLYEPILGSSANNDITDLIDPSGSFLDNIEKLKQVNPQALRSICERIQRQVSADDQAGTVTFKLSQPWGPFLMTLAAPSSSILDMKWAAEGGAWDGSCDTWQNYYARTIDETNQTVIGKGENVTGPYLLDHWTAGQELVLKANPSYWRTEPAWPGGPSGQPSIKTVTIQFLKSYSGRINLFKSGQVDALGFFTPKDPTEVNALVGETCSLQGNCQVTNAAGSSLRVYQDLPATSRMDALFNFTINTDGGNQFIGSGQIDGNGITPNFFTDVHIRQAFNYCFDWDAYIKQAFNGQARQVSQVMLPGELAYNPDGQHYSFNPQACADAFKASVWKGPNGEKLWDIGFSMQLAYNVKDPVTQIIAQILQQNIASVNPKFVIQVTNVPGTIYADAYRSKKLPILFATYHEVLPDPHVWADAYTLSRVGHGIQRMPRGMRDQFWGLVMGAVSWTDPAVRTQLYQKFSDLYFQQAPAILLAQEFDSHYEQRWVKGYFFNPVYGDLYYYALSKQ